MGKLAHMVSTQRFLFSYFLLGKERLNTGELRPSDSSLLEARLYQPAVTSLDLHVPNLYIRFVVTLTFATRSS